MFLFFRGQIFILLYSSVYMKRGLTCKIKYCLVYAAIISAKPI